MSTQSLKSEHHVAAWRQYRIMIEIEQGFLGLELIINVARNFKLIRLPPSVL